MTDDAAPTDDPAITDELDPGTVLDRLGFDPDESVLTRRQAQVLALRERGHSQAAIADALGTSRANVAGVETSARENVARARETVAFAETLSAPVQVTVDAGTDLYDVPPEVFAACDDAGVKVRHTAPELMRRVTEGAGDAVGGRAVHEPLVVGVTDAGEVRVRRAHDDG